MTLFHFRFPLSEAPGLDLAAIIQDPKNVSYPKTHAASVSITSHASFHITFVQQSDGNVIKHGVNIKVEKKCTANSNL